MKLQKCLFTGCLAAVFLLAACNDGNDNNISQSEHNQEVDEMEHEIGDLQSENNELRDKIDNLQTEIDNREAEEMDEREAVIIGQKDQFEDKELVDEVGVGENVTVNGLTYTVREAGIAENEVLGNERANGVFYEIDINIMNPTDDSYTLDWEERRYILDENGQQSTINNAASQDMMSGADVTDGSLNPGSELKGQFYFDITSSTAEAENLQLYIGEIEGDEYGIINLNQ